jgi:hypothetical protein
VVIVRDVDRLTRNLTHWNRFEKACVRHGVLLSPYTGGDLDLSTPEARTRAGWRRCAPSGESAVKSARVREAKERQARAGKRSGGGALWFGYVRFYANPDEPVARKRGICGRNSTRSTRPPYATQLSGSCGVSRWGRSSVSGTLGRPASGGCGVVAVVVRGHADLAAHRGTAGLAGEQVPHQRLARDHRRGHRRTAGEAVLPTSPGASTSSVGKIICCRVWCRARSAGTG